MGNVDNNVGEQIERVAKFTTDAIVAYDYPYSEDMISFDSLPFFLSKKKEISALSSKYEVKCETLYLFVFSFIISKFNEDRFIPLYLPRYGDDKNLNDNGISYLVFDSNENDSIVESIKRVESDLDNSYHDVNSSSNTITRYEFEYVKLDTGDDKPVISEINGEIRLSVLDCLDRDQITITFRKDLFNRETILCISECIVSAIDELYTGTATNIGELSCLPASQIDKIFKYGTGHRIEVESKVFHKYFEERAGLHPNKTAVVCGNDTISYEALNKKSNTIARALRHRGVGPEVVVGVVLERSLEMIISIIGILKSGGAYAPIDPDQPITRICNISNKPFIKLVITEESIADSIPSAISYKDLAKESCEFDDSNPNFECRFNELMYVLHTSGSTGEAKAVGVEHYQFMHYLHSRIDMVGSLHDANFAMISTFAADVGHTAVFPTLKDGGTLHIIKNNLFHDAVGLSNYFRNNSIDCLKIVCSHYQALIAATDSKDIVPKRLVIVGGVACPWDFAEEVRNRNPNVMMLNSFGHTETAVGATAYIISDGRKAHHGKFVPAGKPLANVEMFVLDSRQRMLPIGAVGEIYIGGDRVTRGYLNSEEKTALQFIDHPFTKDSGRKLYKTGDWGRIAFDGNLQFSSRKDDQIKIRGYRIELAEIEHAISSVNKVNKSVVLPKKNKSGDTYLVAYVGVEVDDKENYAEYIKDTILNVLPKYMVPEYYCILDKIPLDKNGKIDRKLLLQLEAIKIGSSSGIGDLHREIVDPEILARLSKIWKDVLGVESVSLDESFFDIGGDSLSIIRMIGKIRREFLNGKNVKVEELVSNPTIIGMGNLIKK